VDHKKFVILVRNAELVFEVRRRLGPATAKIYEIVLDLVQTKLKEAREDMEGNIRY
jgi:hypothetical protein